MSAEAESGANRHCPAWEIILTSCAYNPKIKKKQKINKCFSD
jgi:hypothetical protein